MSSCPVFLWISNKTHCISPLRCYIILRLTHCGVSALDTIGCTGKGELTMKKDIHPSYGESVVRCACGETFTTGSVKGELKVEICSKCHPFYTGRQKLIDSGGRVDRFKKRYGM